jgi:hypothetical protein
MSWWWQFLVVRWLVRISIFGTISLVVLGITLLLRSKTAFRNIDATPKRRRSRRSISKSPRTPSRRSKSPRRPSSRSPKKVRRTSPRSRAVASRTASTGPRQVRRKSKSLTKSIAASRAPAALETTPFISSETFHNLHGYFTSLCIGGGPSVRQRKH